MNIALIDKRFYTDIFSMLLFIFVCLLSTSCGTGDESSGKNGDEDRFAGDEDRIESDF